MNNKIWKKGLVTQLYLTFSLQEKCSIQVLIEKNVQNVKQGALALCFTFILLLCVKLTFYA